MKARTLTVWMTGLLLSASFTSNAQNVPVATGRYTPDWDNLAQWECPEWFQNVKFGIWAHWDPQSQGADGDWYGRGMYFKGGGNYNWHVSHFGDPCVAGTDYGYKDLCNAWKAEKWEPEYLIRLYYDMGARYFFAMGQHHDNFDCWDSPYQPWNSVNIGPKRDVVGEWAKACEKYDLPLGVSMHGSHAWLWFEIAQQYDANMTKEDGKGKWWEGYDPQDLYAQRHTPSRGWEDAGTIHSQWTWGNGASQPSEEYKMKFQNRVLQCVNAYHPAMLYFDDTVLPFYGCDESVGLNILAHSYNTDPEMVVTGKVLDSTHKEAMLWDIERGIPDRPQEKPWQTCTCIGGWHYGVKDYNVGYKSAQQVVDMLVDIVSKNGNLLLSIPLKGDGTHDDKEMRFIAEMTDWMEQNGRSIYGTRVWKTFGEGPLVDASNPIYNQGFNEGINYSAKDVRYVVKHARTEQGVDTVFATIMRWPAERTFTFAHLGRANEYFSGEIESIELLGHGAVEHELAMEGLTVQLPIENTNDIAPVFAITFKPGTDKPISLAEFIDYCKPLVEGADGNLKPVNTGSPNVSALSDLGYYVTQAENSLDGTVEEQAAALVVLRKAFQAYLKASVTEAGAPLYAGDNLTVEMLVEAADFSRTPDTRNGKRFGKPANWIVTNFNIPNGSEGVKQGLDAYEGTEALMLGVWDDRTNVDYDCDLSQAAIRRTVHLTPGTYYFGATFNAVYQLSDEAYMYACPEAVEDLQTSEIPVRAIAWARLNTAPNNGSWWGITFIVEEEQDVTLGFQANLMMGSGTQEFRATRVQLCRYDESKIVAARDVTLQLLDERSNFSRLDGSVTTRFATPKYWQVENFKIPNEADGIKNGIDNYPGYSCLMLGVWDDRSGNQEGNLSDARIYRKLHLDAGVYTMQAEYQTSYSISPDAYMFASTKLLATHDIPAKSLARLAINKAGVDDGKWYSISFSIKESQDVYVGWQANLEEGSETQEFRVKDIRMLYEPWQIEDAVIAVKNTPAGQDTHYYNLKGQQLSDAPQHGLYIKNGRKVLK